LSFFVELSDLKVEPDGSIASQILHGVDLNNDLLGWRPSDFTAVSFRIVSPCIS